jgi:hypothetical protein
MSLKHRVKKLEEASIEKTYPGIVLHYANSVREEIDGVSKIVSADYYLVNSDEGEPLTNKELEEALEGKTYICHLPVQDKRPEYIDVGIFKNTKSQK